MKISLDFNAQVGKEDIQTDNSERASLYEINNDNRVRIVKFVT
jgi:hypothetical protein